MRLIADSGATHTNWVLDNGSDLEFYTSPGINPSVQMPSRVKELLHSDISDDLLNKEIKQLIFYGAGCRDKDNAMLMKTLLEELWPKAEILVYHDLLGAARATLDDDPGIAAILGTGSSSGLYDGKEIIESIPSLGYIVGDEGSGAWFGKHLVRDYCYGLTPKYLSEKLKKSDFPDDIPNLLNKIYKSSGPNSFLASLTPVLKEFEGQPYARKLLKDGFSQFLDYHIGRYPFKTGYTITFCGSIAYHFKTALGEACVEKGYRNFYILQSPLNGLVTFHRNGEK